MICDGGIAEQRDDCVAQDIPSADEPEADGQWLRWTVVRGALAGATLALVAIVMLVCVENHALELARNPVTYIAVIGAMALGAMVGSLLSLVTLGLAYAARGIVGIVCLHRMPQEYKAERILLEDDLL
jgi:hypothetical protein